LNNKDISKGVLFGFYAGVLFDAAPVWRSVLRRCVARYCAGMA
jgi:hypothetical protein